MIQCLIVDDEPIAREILRHYCRHLPGFQIAGSCGDVFEAREILARQPVNILFIDINMPALDGLSFVRTLRTPGLQVIFTTAYSEYAASAFDTAACDYLLKPIPLDRFLVAADRALKMIRLPTAGDPSPPLPGLPAHLFVKQGNDIHRVLHSDLLYAEASRNSTRLVTNKAVLQPSMTFTSVEQLLPYPQFVRTHRSFIVNVSHISQVNGNVVLVGKYEVPIGHHYKERFLKSIGC